MLEFQAVTASPRAPEEWIVIAFAQRFAEPDDVRVSHRAEHVRRTEADPRRDAERAVVRAQRGALACLLLSRVLAAFGHVVARARRRNDRNGCEEDSDCEFVSHEQLRHAAWEATRSC